MSQPSLFERVPIVVSQSAQVPTLISWAPGDMYRAMCGCLIHVLNAKWKVIACSPFCSFAEHFAQSGWIPPREQS